MTIIGHPVRKEVLRGYISIFAGIALWELLARALAENELLKSRPGLARARSVHAFVELADHLQDSPAGALPFIITGMCLGVSRALLAVVAAEARRLQAIDANDNGSLMMRKSWRKDSQQRIV